MRTAAALLLALLLTVQATPLALAQGGARDRDKAPWFTKDCVAPCANLAPRPCADVGDEDCFRQALRQQRRQDQCIHACEKAFWNSHDAGGYRQFKYR